jgi:hypothetical protein
MKSLLLFISLLAHAVIGLSKEMRIEVRDLNGRKHAIIQGDACDDVISLVKDIAQWKSLRDPKDPTCQVSLQHITQNQPKTSLCEYDITDCLPNSVRDLVQIGTSKFDGPQCFNTAMVAAGLTPGLRTTGYFSASSGPEYEIDEVLSSPLCHRVNHDDRKTGDIGVLVLKQYVDERQFPRMKHDGKGNYVPQSNHALIYIGHGVTFSKANSTRNSSMGFSTVSEEAKLQRFFAAEKECETDPTVENCTEGFEYYRCQTFKEFLSKGNFDEKFQRAASVVEDSEIAVGRMMASGKYMDDHEVETIRGNTILALNIIKDQKNKLGFFNGDQQVFLKILAFRISGLARQLWFDQGYIFPADLAGAHSLAEDAICSECTGKMPPSYKTLSKELAIYAESIRSLL